MSAVLHMTAFNSIPHGPAFTSVNGRSSLSPTEDQKPPIAARSTTWTPLSRGPENGYHSPDSVTSASTVSSGDRSPTSPKNNKRRRSASAEDKYAVRSPEQIPVGSRQLPRPFQLNSMENPQQRSQADPMTRPECDRRWATEPRELPQQHYSHPDFQHREPRPTEPVQNIKSSVTDDRDSPEQEDTNATEVTRAGVQVELKKRKRVCSLNVSNDPMLTNESNSPTVPRQAAAHVEGERRSAMKRSPNVCLSYYHRALRNN
jgi:hypothetical protein